MSHRVPEPVGQLGRVERAEQAAERERGRAGAAGQPGGRHPRRGQARTVLAAPIQALRTGLPSRAEAKCAGDRQPGAGVDRRGDAVARPGRAAGRSRRRRPRPPSCRAGARPAAAVVARPNREATS